VKAAYILPSLQEPSGWRSHAIGFLSAISKYVEPLLFVAQSDYEAANSLFKNWPIYALPNTQGASASSLSGLRKLFATRLALTALQSPEIDLVHSLEAYPTTGSTLPDVEDINRDNTLSEKESYYEYHVDLRPGSLQVGQNYITDKVTKTSNFSDGTTSAVNWYQFRIPINDWESKVGSIQDFKSIRFMRMYLSGFDRPVILRFAKLDLVRGEWRRYQRPCRTSASWPTNSRPCSIPSAWRWRKTRKS